MSDENSNAVEKDPDNSGNVINVIDQFDYSTQDERYNEKYRKWRTRRDNPYAFTFERNPKETVYIDNRGFVEHSAKETEASVLSKIFRTIGLGLLMFIVFDDVFFKLIVMVCGRIGLNLNANFSSNTIYGGSTEVAAALMLGRLIRMAIPLVYFHFKFKLPMRTEVMWKMRDPMAFIGAVSIAFIVFIAGDIPSAYSTDTKEVFSFFAAGSADVSVWDQKEFLIYSIFNIIVMPVLTQLLFCGGMFAVMRQFGDPFAIIMTAVTAALLNQDLSTMLGVALVTAVGAYGMLCSGTIFTPIAVNILYKMYLLAMAMIESTETLDMPAYRTTFMCIILMLGGAGIMCYIRHLRKKPAKLAVYSSEVTFGMRIINSAKVFPYSAVAVLCLTYSVIKGVL